MRLPLLKNILNVAAHQLRRQLLPAAKESVRTGTDVLRDSEEDHHDAGQPGASPFRDPRHHLLGIPGTRASTDLPPALHTL
jgi:hypothetical protein